MKKFLKWLFILAMGLVVLVFALVGPIDRTPLQEQEFYKDMMAVLDTLKLEHHDAERALEVGWSVAAITPDHAMPMAGYKPRKAFSTVHDSLFTRIALVDNGSVSVFFISSDLLLFPPALKEEILKQWKSLHPSRSFLYFSATHTHNGVGAWHDSVLGNLALGDFDERWIKSAATEVVEKMKDASLTKLPSKISWLENDVSDWVENRIAFESGTIDGKMRGLVAWRSDGTKGLLFAFGAHATSISKESLDLSGDYPAAVIDSLQRSDWDFAMFMAGMVGSHRFKWMPNYDYDAIAKEKEILVEKIENAHVEPVRDSATICVKHVPINFGSSQLRIAKNWKVRDWVFRALASPLKGEITYVSIGNVTFLGTPCDFSGEIFTEMNWSDFEKTTQRHLMITSFNGEYTGYVTYDPHYDSLSKDEVMTMNWVGPHFGEYYSTIITRLIDKK